MKSGRFTGFMMRLAQKYQIFMAGHYGYDTLGLGLIIFAILLSLVFSFVRTPYWAINLLLRAVCYVPYIIMLCRFLSKDIPARQKENAAFMKFIAPYKKKAEKKMKQMEDTTHKYYDCPKCKATLRVPKNRGKINIECPHCHHKFKKNTGKKL